MTQKTTRRTFIQHSAQTTAAVAALGGAGAFAGGQPQTVNLGIIGCGGIMNHHVKGLVSRREAVSINYLCDVDPRQIDNISKHLDGFQKTRPQRTLRYEDVIADNNVDAVIIATPHHWHAPIAVRAMQAGKDVYIEKPISHVYNEGHIVKAAAKKYGRIVQQGSQMRSSPVTEQAGRLLKEGRIGEVQVARAWTAETRSVVKPVPDGTPPSGVDYDRWLGPAPKRDFNKHRFHYTWRLFRDYGNGEIGDDGIHDIDMACWGLGIDTLPKQVTARGGRMLLHGHVSDYPDNLHVTWEYPDGRVIVYENYPFTAYGLHGFDNGNVFYGTEGYMVFSRRGAFRTFLGPKGKPGPASDKKLRGRAGYGYPQHMANFLTGVRSRRPTRASADVAHLSCALVHLADIANQTTGRLDFNPKTEKFIDNQKANELLTKEYRKPYQLPDTSNT